MDCFDWENEPPSPELRRAGPRHELEAVGEQLQTLASVCRLIAGRTPEPNIAEELRELAGEIESGVERYRAAVGALRPGATPSRRDPPPAAARG
jgi:hypothetical protein